MTLQHPALPDDFCLPRILLLCRRMNTSNHSQLLLQGSFGWGSQHTGGAQNRVHVPESAGKCSGHSPPKTSLLCHAGKCEVLSTFYCLYPAPEEKLQGAGVVSILAHVIPPLRMNSQGDID